MEDVILANTRGKVVIYIDAEFQAYKVKLEDGKDKLYNKKFTPTNPFLHTPEDLVSRKYHFLLSLGAVVYDGDKKPELLLATFPSEYNAGVGFENVQTLEKNYTVCRSDVKDEIEKTSRLVGQHFKYVGDLTDELKEKIRDCHAFYNRKRHLNDRSGSKADFERFMSLLTKKECVLIHKGENDIVALKNTLTKMELGLPPFEDIDLDRASMLHKNVPNKRLNTLNSHYGRLYPELVAEKDELMGKIARFMKDRFLEDAGDLTSHNPLVDCAAALVLYKGTRKMLEKAASSGGGRRMK